MAEKAELSIKKDDLTGIARQLENLQVLLGDLLEGYFEAYNVKDEKDRYAILWGYRAQKHYVDIANTILFDCVNELHKKDIWCFNKEVVA